MLGFYGWNWWCISILSKGEKWLCKLSSHSCPDCFRCSLLTIAWSKSHTLLENLSTVVYFYNTVNLLALLAFLDHSLRGGTCKAMLQNIKLIDELGNWCHQRLVGGPQKYNAQPGGSMATLQVGAIRANGHQPALLPWGNFSKDTYLTQYPLWPDSFEGREGLGTKLANWVAKAVIHKDQQSKKTANMVTKVEIHQR